MAGRKLAPWVTHERLDDEVIAINLETGAYFALDDVAADCWTLIVGATPDDEAISLLCGRYEVEPDTVRADLTRFTAELEAEGLVLPEEAAGTAAVTEL